MIKRATVKNYQSWAKGVFKFSEGVNVIVGLSDTGKSALMRALQWPIRNKNEDKGFRSNWGGVADVELVFDDGQEVSRVQDEHNHYFLVDPEREVDEEYKAFKSDIPEEVAAALNMDSINIQSQFDSPFLLSDSSSEVAKTLNRIADLSDIDTTVSNIRKMVLANSRDISVSEQILADLTLRKDKFDYLSDMEQDVSRLEDMIADNDEIHNLIIGLDSKIMSLESDQKIIDELNLFLKAESDLTAALGLMRKLDEVTEQISTLRHTIKEIETDNEQISDLEAILKASNEVKAALDDVDDLKEIKKQIDKLKEHHEAIRRTAAKIDSLSTRLYNLEEEYRQKMPEVCPLCGK